MGTVYSGPGKLFYNGRTVIWPQAINGQMIYQLNQTKMDYGNAMFGRTGSILGGTVGRLTVTPYDNWAALIDLFPPYIGATTQTAAGVLRIGQRPHNPDGAGDVSATIWNPNGVSIKLNRCACTRHPDLHLGTGKPLYGQAEFTTLPTSTNGNNQVSVGDPNAFHTITEAGAADPGGVYTTADFVREAWRGAWGTIAGFAGDGTFNGAPLQAEEEWIVSTNATYDPLPVQEQVQAFKLASVEFMAHCRLFGPTWTQIDNAVALGRRLGSRFANPGDEGAQQDLVLYSQSGKSITIYNADAHGEGFEFGGTRLATGEVGFVTQLVASGSLQSAGVSGVKPLIVFSA